MNTTFLDNDALCDRFDRMIGLDYVMSLWHSGGGSVGYRLLCRAKIVNPPDIRKDRENNGMARHYAARYLMAVRARLKRKAW